VLGLDPSQYSIVVVKIGYLVPDLERLASTNLMALSPGSVFPDVKKLKYERGCRPIYTKDDMAEWVPTVFRAKKKEPCLHLS